MASGLFLVLLQRNNEMIEVKKTDKTEEEHHGQCRLGGKRQ